MNNMEEKLWDYIDGNGTPAEREEIAHLIATNADYKTLYNQLLQFNNYVAAVELDEPPMAFTYNVMEQIRAETAVTPLKSAVNKNIIRGLAAFFLFTIVIMLAYILGHVNWTAPSNSSSQLNLSQLSGLASGPALKVFLFFDVILLLVFADSYLRRQRFAKQG